MLYLLLRGADLDPGVSCHLPGRLKMVAKLWLFEHLKTDLMSSLSHAGWTLQRAFGCRTGAALAATLLR